MGWANKANILGLPRLGRRGYQSLILLPNSDPLTFIQLAGHFVEPADTLSNQLALEPTVAVREAVVHLINECKRFSIYCHSLRNKAPARSKVIQNIRRLAAEQ